MTRHLVTILFLTLGLSMNLQAQRQKFAITPQVGVVIPALDSGIGLHIGINPTARLLSWISAEGQLSFSATRITNKFLSGQPRTPQRILATQAIGGFRFYLNRERKKYRPFLHAMFGAGYFQETDLTPGFEAAGSYGIFLQGPHLMGGMSIETPGALILKLGYTLPVGKKSGQDGTPLGGS